LLLQELVTHGHQLLVLGILVLAALLCLQGKTQFTGLSNGNPGTMKTIQGNLL
jgi:hypothetical protein